jgi:hypothetical protein
MVERIEMISPACAACDVKRYKQLLTILKFMHREFTLWDTEAPAI